VALEGLQRWLQAHATIWILPPVVITHAERLRGLRKHHQIMNTNINVLQLVSGRLRPFCAT
jgi:hypothetical protein